jgi:hypothetical protein
MKVLQLASAASLALIGTAAASNLYYMGEDVNENLPLKWTVGVNLIWDDNVNPTIPNIPFGNPAFEEDATAINPYVGASWINITPQTTYELYARLGMIYYFDEPSALGSDDAYPDAKLGFNLTHRFSDRLRWVSRNYIAYQLEPDYDYGFANSRLADAYLYWNTDQSLGYKWTDRFATYTGVRFWGIDYDSAVANQDRTSWMVYNDFRYQLSPQSVLTFSYRYSETDAGGLASDSTSQYALLGIEHRVSPTTIFTVRGGAQFYDVDSFGGSNETGPYIEAIVRSRINDQFNVRAYARYGYEVYDNVFFPIQYDSNETLRIGVSGDYELSPMVNLFGGIAYIGRDYDDGRNVVTGFPVPGLSPSEDLINAYVGVSVKFNDWLYGQATYNYTNSDSDILGRDYDRNRVSIGMRAEF